jgi:hypothetical protein
MRRTQNSNANQKRNDYRRNFGTKALRRDGVRSDTQKAGGLLQHNVRQNMLRLAMLLSDHGLPSGDGS